MRNLIFLLTVLSLCCVTSGARELYCQPPMPIDAGSEFCDTLPGHMLTCDYHFRVELPFNSGLSLWGVKLVYDNGEVRRIVMKRDGSHVRDVDYAAPLAVIYTGVMDDKNAFESAYMIDGHVDASVDGWSIRLVKRYEDDSLRCCIGQRESLLTFSLPADGLHSLVSNSETKMGLSRLSLFAEGSDERALDVPFDSLEQLSEYLTKSTDQAECMWLYLDRDTDQRRINLGGDYHLATVRRCDGAYDILYLGGARVNSGSWQGLRVKGRLLPTIFSSHYDLIWYDAFGRMIDLETSADIIDGSILKLNFPLYGGTIRFRRDIMHAEPSNP